MGSIGTGTSKENGAAASNSTEYQRLLEIKNNLEKGAAITGTSANTQKQLAEIDQKLKSIKEAEKRRRK